MVNRLLRAVVPASRHRGSSLPSVGKKRLGIWRRRLGIETFYCIACRTKVQLCATYSYGRLLTIQSLDDCFPKKQLTNRITN